MGFFMSKFVSMRQLWLDAAKESGAHVSIVNELPQVLRLEFPDGVLLFSQNDGKHRIPLSSVSSIGFTNDKDLSAKLLTREGLPTPRTHIVPKHAKHFDKLLGSGSRHEKELLAFIDHVGFPVFVKPNKGSQGRNVFRVDSMDALEALLPRLAEGRKEYFVVQEACMGTEYRVVVVAGEIKLALQRNPLTVSGDGKSPVSRLIRREIAELRENGRRIKLKEDSPKIADHLRRQGLDLDTVLPEGQTVAVIANKNLSDGARPVACTEKITSRYADLCRAVNDRLGIGYCGIDLIEADRKEGPQPFILEINGSPGYKHFVGSDPVRHGKMVRDVFVAVLQETHKRQKAASRPAPEAEAQLATLDS